MPIEVVSVIGARPQFVKAAVVSRALAARGIAEAVVHTGQHYDEAMSGRFLSQLGIDVAANLAVGSGGHAEQTARMMTGFADYLAGRPRAPDIVVVYGDTNSTIAAGLVVSKLGIPLAHVEAGLRSYNRAMPEEVNRVVVDHLSDILFCSSPVGIENLKREGVETNVSDVGDVMLDAFQLFSKTADRSGVPDEPFVLATIHRPANTDDPARLQGILNAFGTIGTRVVWPVHPRNRQAIGQLDVPANLALIEPVGYLEMLALLAACVSVATDSGGLQKEAHWAGKPCLTIRSETEWTETLDGGWNVLADPSRDDFRALASRTPKGSWRLLYGDGRASQRIADALAAFVHARR